ncbi:hypothetical protein C5Y96_09695 [Blastopirellula marina]|uniref:DUF2625 domain-containing protein n=1 Tax=Blastopirellula marina TaxID=124 RepID=A0A2S8FT10_9BACT|nr:MULTISPECIES: DUF2625 family protein [Pirellulaceae]PQO35297.1 hypothetical protein C5Y96_09695 [Blastopirellula marina]RCS53166.1 DUF2625 family protein [Bremerella cremea]
MRLLEELLDANDPGIQRIREWTLAAAVDVVVLPPSAQREQVLLDVQVTTRSTMGAIAYETGGIVVDNGWLRFLGSGHPSFTRTLPAWNQGRCDGFYLIADDAVGGFFAINGGKLGDDFGNVYYLAPDDLDWQPLEMGYTDLFHSAVMGYLSPFYADLRWTSWQADTQQLAHDRCFFFYPFLWTAEGSIEKSVRSDVPATEAFGLKIDFLQQFKAE